uniref:DUF4590 domain-containing protein n=1 Tax=Leptobrachium leishanense TaxID=445787 RepID=A0A8C5QXK2_9ANUR
MSHPYHGPLSAYNSLTDKHLTGYFNNTRIKRQLQRAGLITRSGRILSEKEYRINAMRRDHQKYIRECLAQAIFHKVLDMERHHQIEIKRKLESFARKERVQRIKVDHSRRTEEDTAPVFSPRPPTGPRSGLNRQMTAQVEGSDSSEASSSPRPNTAPGNMQRPYRLQPLNGTSSHGNAPKTSSGSRHKQSSDDHEQSFSKGVERDIWKLINTMDHPMGISPYRLPIINNFVMPAPPPTQKGPKQSANYSSRGRRYRPTTAPNGLEPLSKDSQKFQKTSPHSNVKITMSYLGKNVHLSHEDDDYRDEIKIFQQHCGGENLCVYKGRLLEGESFNLTSRRHRGFPFSLTFFINGMQVDRLSSCCEYKHRKGARLGGRNGHFGFVDIEGASPCYRCIIAMGLDKKPSPPPKKSEEEEESDSEDEKHESQKRSPVESDVSDEESHGDDEEKREDRSLKESSHDDVRKDADMEFEEEGGETNEENNCTDMYEADDEGKNEYDEDFEVDEEKSDAKHNEEGRSYDEVDRNSKSPSDDEKDDLKHETESNKSSKPNAQPSDSQKDERDGHSESENEGDKQGKRSIVEKDMNSAARKIQKRYRQHRTRRANSQKAKTDMKHDAASISSASSVSSSSSEGESDYDGDGEETSRRQPEPERLPSRKSSMGSEKPMTPTTEKLEEEDAKNEEIENEIPELKETLSQAKTPQPSDGIEEHPRRTGSRQENQEKPPESDHESAFEHDDDQPPVESNASDAEYGFDGKTLLSEEEEEDVKSVQEKIAEAMGHHEKRDPEPEASDTSTDEEETFNTPFAKHKPTERSAVESPEMITECNLKEDSKEEKPREEVEQEMPGEMESAVEDRLIKEEECQKENLSPKPEPENEQEMVILDGTPHQDEEADYEAFTDDLLREALNDDTNARIEFLNGDNIKLEDSRKNIEICDLTGLTLEPTEELGEEFQGIEAEEITVIKDDIETVDTFECNFNVVSQTRESMSHFEELKEQDIVDSMQPEEELVVENETDKENVEDCVGPSPSILLGKTSVKELELNNEMENCEKEILEKENDSIITDHTEAESTTEQENVDEQLLHKSTMDIEMQVVDIDTSSAKELDDEKDKTEDGVVRENKSSTSLRSDAKDTCLNADISGEDVQEKDDDQKQEVAHMSEGPKGNIEPTSETANDIEVEERKPDENSGNPRESHISENEEAIIANGDSGEAELTIENTEIQEESEGVMELKKEEDESLTKLNNEEMIINKAGESYATDEGVITGEKVTTEELGEANDEIAIEETSVVVIKEQDSTVHVGVNVEEETLVKDRDVGSEEKGTDDNLEPFDRMESEEEADTGVESRGDKEISESEATPNQNSQEDELVTNGVIIDEKGIPFDGEVVNYISISHRKSVESLTFENDSGSLTCPSNEDLGSPGTNENIETNASFTDNGSNKDLEPTPMKEDNPGSDNEIEGASSVVVQEKEDVSLEVSVVQVFNLTEEVQCNTEDTEISVKESPAKREPGDQELPHETPGGNPEELTVSGPEDIEKTLSNLVSERNNTIEIIHIQSVEETGEGGIAEEANLANGEEPLEENINAQVFTENNISETDATSAINTDIAETSDNQTNEEDNSHLSEANIEDLTSGNESSIVEPEVANKMSTEEPVKHGKDEGEHKDITTATTTLTDKTKLQDEPDNQDKDLGEKDMLEPSVPNETKTADMQENPVADEDGDP